MNNKTMSEGTKKGLESFHRTEIQEDLSDIRSKARETRDSLGRAAQSMTQNVKDKASELYEKSAQQVKDTVSQVKTTAVEAEENTVAFIRRNPLKSIGYAFLAGAILSQFLHLTKGK